jgi:hypothetical protein
MGSDGDHRLRDTAAGEFFSHADAFRIRLRGLADLTGTRPGSCAGPAAQRAPPKLLTVVRLGNRVLGKVACEK